MSNAIQLNVITREFLLSLLSKEESPTLDFKRKPYQIFSDERLVKDKQRGELIKDVLALANGNSIVAGDTAYLIIGADDNRNSNGSRELFDIGNHRITSRNILDIVNSACEPALEDIFCDEVDMDGKRLLVITINPTPYLHETTRRLETSDGFYSECTAFVRHNEGTSVASAKERETISQIKRFRFSEKRNPPGIYFGTLVGGTVGGIMGYAASKGGKLNSQIPDEAYGVVGSFLGVVFGATSASIYKNYYEIRSEWHRYPKKMRAPLIVGSFGVSYVIVRAVGYILKRIVFKK